MRLSTVVLCSLGLVASAEHHASKYFLGLDQVKPEAAYTADDHMCSEIFGLIVFCYCMHCCSMIYCTDASPICFFSLVIISTFGALYVTYHGLVQNTFKEGLDVKNHWHCSMLVVVALIVYYWWCIMACCFAVGGTVAVVVDKMEEDSKAKEAKLRAANATLKTEQEWEDYCRKCMKVFDDADKDGNGKLDIQELQEVALFNLSEEQQAFVKDHDLYKMAFEQNDKNKDKMIDREEFVKLMKWMEFMMQFQQAVQLGLINDEQLHQVRGGVATPAIPAEVLQESTAEKK